MKTVLQILFGLVLSSYIQAQDISDAERLSKMSYMKYADGMNCDSVMSNLEQRVCLNLEFQELDSIVNLKFDFFLTIVKNDSLKIKLKNYQKMWIKNRHHQSVVVSEGFRGHMLGITYLSRMIDATRRRIGEIEYLMER